ncbi:uncharacterized protein BXZ73DRAFT_78244 [Epithele typhae]|uniref:uncharacterized protein n=1 Tax=Epithele typhae TaxID=378194 RepID=UPI0020074F7D|nr:uncharacterized protein BXZ73DRAFT_78244 [Epithele typhae]KAH9929107.1 hypothetical protein BXZ73DRAFT_78244 [Epithele typhae]
MSTSNGRGERSGSNGEKDGGSGGDGEGGRGGDNEGHPAGSHSGYVSIPRSFDARVGTGPRPKADAELRRHQAAGAWHPLWRARVCPKQESTEKMSVRFLAATLTPLGLLILEPASSGAGGCISRSGGLALGTRSRARWGALLGRARFGRPRVVLRPTPGAGGGVGGMRACANHALRHMDGGTRALGERLVVVGVVRPGTEAARGGRAAPDGRVPELLAVRALEGAVGHAREGARARADVEQKPRPVKGAQRLEVLIVDDVDEEGGGGGVRGVGAPADGGGGVGERRAAVGPCGVTGAVHSVPEDVEGERATGAPASSKHRYPVDVPGGAQGVAEEAAEGVREGGGLGVPRHGGVTGADRGDDRPPRARGVGGEAVDFEIDGPAEDLEGLGVARPHGGVGEVVGGVEVDQPGGPGWAAAAKRGQRVLKRRRRGLGRGDGGGGGGGAGAVGAAAAAGRATKPLRAAPVTPFPFLLAPARATVAHVGAGTLAGAAGPGAGWVGAPKGLAGRAATPVGTAGVGAGGTGLATGAASRTGAGGGEAGGAAWRGGAGRGAVGGSSTGATSMASAAAGGGGGRPRGQPAHVHGQHTLCGVLAPELGEGVAGLAGRLVEEVGGLREVGLVDGAKPERDPKQVEEELSHRGRGRSCRGRGAGAGVGAGPGSGSCGGGRGVR